MASRDQCLSSGFTGDHVKTYFRAIGGMELKLICNHIFSREPEKLRLPERTDGEAGRRDNGEKKLFEKYNQAFSTVKKIKKIEHYITSYFSEDH